MSPNITNTCYVSFLFQLIVRIFGQDQREVERPDGDVTAQRPRADKNPFGLNVGSPPSICSIAPTGSH